MHSAVFAVSPRSAGELALRFVRGGVRRLVDAEVMDVTRRRFARAPSQPASTATCASRPRRRSSRSPCSASTSCVAALSSCRTPTSGRYARVVSGYNREIVYRIAS